jgi:thioredoxin reductase (NADPH)
MKDLIIIGGGPAGLTAGIYGKRAGLDLVLIEKFSPGGQVVTSFEIENYPGFAEPVEGWKLMADMEDQARRLGVDIINDEILSIDREGGTFTVRGNGEIYKARTVIVAAGANHRRLDIPGEKELLGRGVSFCATCDGAFFKDREVIIAGGGDVALEEAFFLTRFASRVYIAHRRDQFRGAKILQDRVLGCEKITPLYNTEIESVNGSGNVESVTVRNNISGKKDIIKLDGVFIFVGYVPNTAFLESSLLNESGEVIVDIRMRTAVDGLFAAGDIRSGSRRQIVMAASDGAVAALEAYDYITALSCT